MGMASGVRRWSQRLALDHEGSEQRPSLGELNPGSLSDSPDTFEPLQAQALSITQGSVFDSPGEILRRLP